MAFCNEITEKLWEDDEIYFHALKKQLKDVYSEHFSLLKKHLVNRPGSRIG